MRIQEGISRLIVTACLFCSPIIGAKLANPDKFCLNFMGDGAFGMSGLDIETSVREGAPITTIVLNNGGWNAVRHSTLAVFPRGKTSRLERAPVTAISPSPDIVKIAQASRAWAKRVNHGEDLPALLKRAINVVRKDKRQALLEINATQAG